MKTAAVIGSGIAGMAAAIRLALQKFDVTVFESNNFYGGKASELKKDGFRFDRGSALFTMPHLVDDLFLAAGRKPQHYFRYQPLEVNTKYFFPDGSELLAYRDAKKFSKEVEAKLGVPAKKVKGFLKRSAQIYHATSGTILHKSLHKSATYFSPEIIKLILSVPVLNFKKTMHEANSSQFSEPRFLQILDRYASCAGSNPYQAPATLNIIPHIEHNIGGFFPEGGIYAVAKSLFKLAGELGVKFRFQEKAEEIMVGASSKKITGLRTTKGSYDFDVVISNMDVLPTYRKLLPNHKAPEKILSQPRSASALIFYWGMNRVFPELDLHNIFFSEDYKLEFEHIFSHKSITADPTIHLSITSKIAKKDAPANHENWHVMVNVPHHDGHDWNKLVAETRQNIVRKLNAHLKTDLDQHIVSESVWNPQNIEEETHSLGGSLYGNRPLNVFSAFMRHPNFNRNIKGLYFCGGSVHPGGGIPHCLLSAKIVSDLVEKDFKHLK